MNECEERDWVVRWLPRLFFLGWLCDETNYHDKESTSMRWFMGKDDKFGFGHVVVHVRHPKAIWRKKMKYMGL